jgi:hypothetical protein
MEELSMKTDKRFEMVVSKEKEDVDKLNVLQKEAISKIESNLEKIEKCNKKANDNKVE